MTKFKQTNIKKSFTTTPKGFKLTTFETLEYDNLLDANDLFFSAKVVAVFGSMHMGASRLVNLQRHRIAQCRSIVIRILGDEGVPVQVDGEAWLHPPGIIRILHKNRVQLVSRDKVSSVFKVEFK